MISLADCISTSRIISLGYDKVINDCKNSTPDHGLTIVDRVNEVRGSRTEPRNWRRRIPEAPNWHFTSTVRLDGLSSIDDVVYATEREHPIILLCQHR